MTSWLRLLPGALLLGSLTAAVADPVPPPAAQSRQFSFAFRLLPTSVTRGPVATGAPMNLLPENLPPPRQVSRPAVLVNVPLPRPRPRTVEATPGAAVAAVAPPVAVDGRTTGSVTAPEVAAPPLAPAADAVPTDAPAAPAESAGAPTPAAPAPVAEAAPPPAEPEPVALEPDGLASDPDSFQVEQEDVGPHPLAPTAIRPPRQVATLDPTDAAAPPVFIGKPYELVRSLQLLQDRMVHGDFAALSAQHALRAEIDRAFAAAEPSVWTDRRNAEAALIYVLSGGSPEILRRITGLDPKPEIDEGLLAGVFAYATGDAATAAPLLDAVDLFALPVSMAGLVGIAKSALVIKSDPDKAMKLLALVRLMSTGTLIEEAALRRELFVADQRHDEPAVMSLARQYLDRFRHSVYASNFRSRLAAAISHMRTIDREDRFVELDKVLAMLDPEARAQLYLTIALASTINRRVGAARLAAERASGLALANSPEESRARLYHAAALIGLPGQADKAAANLDGLNPAALGPADQALLKVVEATVVGVRSGTDRAAITVAVAEPLGDGAVADERPVMTRAQALLNETQTLVGTK